MSWRDRSIDPIVNRIVDDEFKKKIAVTNITLEVYIDLLEKHGLYNKVDDEVILRLEQEGLEDMVDFYYIQKGKLEGIAHGTRL